MSWYVFAVVDRPPAGRHRRGLAGALTARRVPGGFAIVERRADVPPAEFGTLRRHDDIVARIAEDVPAVLPVRFGTLMDMNEIEEALADREEELAEAFEAVRGRVQFTWRTPRTSRTLRAPRMPRAGDAGSGTEYLRRAARARPAAAPAAFKAMRERLRPLVAAERYQAATASLPDSLYHLVDRSRVARYRLIAARLASPALRVTGPFPPFAFAPVLL